jgi:hypothetical protein
LSGTSKETKSRLFLLLTSVSVWTNDRQGSEILGRNRKDSDDEEHKQRHFADGWSLFISMTTSDEGLENHMWGGVPSPSVSPAAKGALESIMNGSSIRLHQYAATSSSVYLYCILLSCSSWPIVSSPT